MWVGLDWLGQLVLDATLATALLLSLVILLMLLCQQPARRIVLAQAATVLRVLHVSAGRVQSHLAVEHAGMVYRT